LVKKSKKRKAWMMAVKSLMILLNSERGLLGVGGGRVLVGGGVRGTQGKRRRHQKSGGHRIKKTLFFVLGRPEKKG